VVSSSPEERQNKYLFPKRSRLINSDDRRNPRNTFKQLSSSPEEMQNKYLFPKRSRLINSDDRQSPRNTFKQLQCFIFELVQIL
jgi:hypothetical protein